MKAIKVDPRMPNLFIIGVVRGGTTTLYYALNEHPDIFFPAGGMKEPGFFCHPEVFPPPPGETRSGMLASLDWNIRPSSLEAYLSLYKSGTSFRYRGDATAAYFYYTSPDTLLQYSPDAHLIVSLRHPLARALSHYFLGIQVGGLPPGISFQEALKRTEHRIITHSLYADRLERWLEHARNRLLILIFEHLQKSPDQVLRKIWNFLNLPPISTIEIRKQHNRSYQPTRLGYFLFRLKRKIFGGRILLPPSVKEKVLPLLARRLNQPPQVLTVQEAELLMETFLRDIEKVEALLGISLPEWKSLDPVKKYLRA